MKIRQAILFLPIAILQCCAGDSPLDTIHFTLINPTLLTSQSHSKFPLDSMTRKLWGDKIMGLQYYSAYSLARFNKVKDCQVIAIETDADDWSKSFLLTVNDKLEIVDVLEITDSYGDAISEKNGTETVTGIESRTEFLNDSTLTRTRIHETIFAYERLSQLVRKDSVVETFVIQANGRFKMLSRDSVRIGI